jgi:hypothetical protein
MLLPEITSESEEAFHDLVFAVVSADNPFRGGATLRAAGAHEGKIVSFEVRLGASWKEGRMGDLETYLGTVVLSSVGGEPHDLARALDKLYETELAPVGMKERTEFTAISLEGNPRKLKRGPVKLKLFVETDDEERYAEVFLNIDLAKSRLQLNEKDPSYREALVLALGAGIKAPSNQPLHTGE